MSVALISGTSIANSSLFADWKMVTVQTPHGEVELLERNGQYALNRHGFIAPRPPHKINYRANVSALKELGISSVISLSSVGSLKEELKPGAFVSCSDYVSFAPITFFDEEMSGFAPSIANNLMGDIRRVSPHAITLEKVYVQTRGPRFETRAEVRILQQWGCDVVGMTLANEVDLFSEMGIAYNSICMPDNYAHGIQEQELSLGTFRDLVAINQKKVDDLLRAILGHFF